MLKSIFLIVSALIATVVFYLLGEYFEDRHLEQDYGEGIVGAFGVLLIPLLNWISWALFTVSFVALFVFVVRSVFGWEAVVILGVIFFLFNCKSGGSSAPKGETNPLGLFPTDTSNPNFGQRLAEWKQKH